jgi:hypothetical protein
LEKEILQIRVRNFFKGKNLQKSRSDLGHKANNKSSLMKKNQEGDLGHKANNKSSLGKRKYQKQNTVVFCFVPCR